MFIILAQVPPTPTPFPTVEPSSVGISLPDISLWDYTDYAIQYWNMASVAMTIFQAVVLALLVLWVIIRVSKKWRAYQDSGEV